MTHLSDGSSEKRVALYTCMLNISQLFSLFLFQDFSLLFFDVFPFRSLKNAFFVFILPLYCLFVCFFFLLFFFKLLDFFASLLVICHLLLSLFHFGWWCFLPSFFGGGAAFSPCGWCCFPLALVGGGAFLLFDRRSAASTSSIRGGAASFLLICFVCNSWNL